MRRALLAAVVVACGLHAAAAHAADKITFLIDWLPAGDKAVPYYGVKSGLFSEAGFDVTIEVSRGSSEVVTKLGTGTGDVGTGGLSALLQAKAEGAVPVKAVLAIYTRQPDALFTVKGGPISSIKDVVGRRIATPTFSSSNVLWPLVLQANGIDPASVTLLKVDPGALAPMLASGQVAATINWVPVAPIFEKVMSEAGKQLAVIPWSEYGFDGYGLSLFATDKMIAGRPAVLKRFLAAYQKATEGAIAHPDQAAAALKAMVPEIDEGVARAQFVASVPLIVNDLSKKDGMGRFEPGLLDKTWEWVAKSQNLPADRIDPRQTVDASFVPE